MDSETFVALGLVPTGNCEGSALIHPSFPTDPAGWGGSPALPRSLE
jgi:hypothetical protein